MKTLHNQDGFTLIELIITTAIIAVSLGMITFGINVIFEANIKSYANQYESDLKDIRQGTISTTERYYLQWKYNADHYYYEIYKMDKVSSTYILMKTVALHSRIEVDVIKNVGGVDVEYDLKDLIDSDINSVSIKFSPSSGSVISVVGNSVYGDGIYRFKDDSESYDIKVIKETGGIFLD